MNRIGLENDRDWMPRCDATFQDGILYRNWYERGDELLHPLFEILEYLDPHTHTGHGWLYLHGKATPFSRHRRSFYRPALYTVTNAYNNRAPFSHE